MIYTMLKTLIQRLIDTGGDVSSYYAKLDNYLKFNQITQEQYDELKSMLDNAQPSEV